MVESDSVIQTLRDIQARGCISRDDLPNSRFRYLLELGYLSGFSSSTLIPGGNHSLYFSVSEKGKQAIHAYELEARRKMQEDLENARETLRIARESLAESKKNNELASLSLEESKKNNELANSSLEESRKNNEIAASSCKTSHLSAYASAGSFIVSLIALVISLHASL